MRHFYATQVKAVGQGVIMSSDGKTLTCIGSMPVQVGDAVYTDGRVVYGHAPIKASGAVFNAPENLVPFYVFFASWKNWEMDGVAGYSKNGQLRKKNRTLENDIWYAQNWMYTYKDKFYFCDYSSSQVGVRDYIDVWRTKNAVYTAEFTGTDAPIFGRNYIKGTATHHRLCAQAVNMYFVEDENNRSEFIQHYLNNGGRVDGNPIVNIKRNGTIVESFALGDYQYALDFLKEIYLNYDAYGEDYKRYHLEGEIAGTGEYIEALDIWVTYMVTQMLSFSFTSNDGAWEMVLLSMVEGSCSPHTIDQEYNRDTEQYENVYSVYSFSCPVIYLIVKVRSDGTKTILHQRINVNSIEDNGVTVEEWENAKTYPVDDVALVDEPYFAVNFCDCALTTNLRRIGQIVSGQGNVIARNLDLDTFFRLCTTNPNGKRTAGALNQYRIYNFLTGNYYDSNTTSFLGIDSGNAYAPVIRYESASQFVTYGQNNASMIERLSLYKFANDTWLVCLRNITLWYVDNNSVHNIGFYPANLNLEMAKIRRQEDSLDMPDLIAAVSNNDS